MNTQAQYPLISGQQATTDHFLKLVGQYHQAQKASGTPAGRRALLMARAALNATKNSVPQRLWTLIEQPTSRGLA